MARASTRDYVAQISLLPDAGLRGILLRLNDAIEQLKEDLATQVTVGTTNAAAVAALTSRVTTAEATLKQLVYSGFQDFQEIGNPDAPARDTGRLYVRDNGSGKSQIVVRFNTGAIQVVATEP